MTTGTVKTQGTRLHFAYQESEILKVLCPTGISGLGGAADQINKSCLDSEESEFERGLLNPGPLSVPVNFIPNSASHQALIALRETGATVSWMIVLSDQEDPPVAVDSNQRLVSPGPTTIEFLGYVSDLAVDIATNEIVRATLTIQRTGKAIWNFPAAIQ